jgi:hypothetical protein
MGLGKSRIDDEYYDRTFGYKYGRSVDAIDLNTIYYIPSNRTIVNNSTTQPLQVLRSSFVDSNKNKIEQRTIFKYIDKPQIVFYPIPTLPPQPYRLPRLRLRPSRRYANQQLLLPYR